MKDMDEYLLFWRDYFRNNDLKLKSYSYLQKLALINFFFQNYKTDDWLKSILEPFTKIEITDLALKIFTDSEKKSLIHDPNLSEEALIPLIKQVSLSDQEKISFYEQMQNPSLRIEVLSQITDDNLKEKYLEKVDGKHYRLQIITSFKDDAKKIKYLNPTLEEKSLTKIIKSFHQDSLKLEYLHLIKSPGLQISIIISLASDNEKLTFLNDSIFNKYDRLSIISSLKDDHLKLNFFKELSRASKKKLASSLRTDEARVKALVYFNDRYDQLNLIEKIDDPYLKNSLLPESLRLKRENFLKGQPFQKMDIPSFQEKLLPKDMTFGIELEMQGLKAINLLTINNRCLRDGWKVKSEDVGLNGIEVTSPILNYTYLQINELYNICAFLVENDFSVNDRCGGHIHIGAHTLDTVASFQMFYYLYLNCEKILYLITNEMSNLPRSGILEYAKPMSHSLDRYMSNGTINLSNPADLDQFIKEMQNFQYLNDIEHPRYHGVNLLNINNGKNTIEFRFPNGSLNPEIIHSNIKLFGRLVAVSKELTRTNLSKEKREALEALSTLSSEREKLELLLAILFKDPEERLPYLDRYIINSYLNKKENPLENINFHNIKKL